MALTPKLAATDELGWAFDEARELARAGPRVPEPRRHLPWHLSAWPAWSVATALAVALALTALPRPPAVDLPITQETPLPKVTFAPIVISSEIVRTLAEIEPVVLLANAAPVDARSLAILPFAEGAGATSAPVGGVIADSIYEQVVRQLRSVPGLYLIDAATAAIYSDSDLAPEEIALQLGVRGVVEGSVDTVDGEIRFELRFTDAAVEGTSLSEAIQRPTDELALLQSDIASSVLGALTHRMPGAESNGTL